MVWNDDTHGNPTRRIIQFDTTYLGQFLWDSENNQLSTACSTDTGDVSDVVVEQVQ